MNKKILNLIRELPALCGARDSWGRSGELQYIDQISNPKPYERILEDIFETRCQSYIAFVEYAKDRNKAIYGVGLLALVDANSKNDKKRADELREQLYPISDMFHDIDEILPYEEASTMDFWN